MARLNIERQEKLEPERMESTEAELKRLGFEIVEKSNHRIDFLYNGNVIKFFPYSGWHTGKGIKDGRGWLPLKKQIAPTDK